MKKYGAVSLGTAGITFLLILLSFGLFGCASPNKIINEDKRIPLVEKGSDSGVFKDIRLTVEYNYNLTGDKIALAGSAHFNGRYNSLTVFLLFLDTTGRRIDKKLVYSSGYRSMAGTSDRSFKKTLAVPPGATAISFSHYSEERNSRD